MIISSNSAALNNEFNLLLNLTTIELNDCAKKSTKLITSLTGNKLEPFVKDIMEKLAIGTPFENSIECIGGLKFPDIVAKKFYGIEVKTTTQNHWKTTGNSVLESTRIEDVEKIFMLFAKLASPVEFKYRAYEECLSEVVVTHSPRYLIDMNLEMGKTIFDKIKIPYDTLRKKDNPIKPILDYYKSKLKPGQELWWIDPTKSTNIVITNWANLTIAEKQNVKNKAMIYFPELFSNSNDKFSRLGIWLVTQEGVVCNNLRDLFTAGGKGELIIGRKKYINIPRVFLNMFSSLDSIIEHITVTPTTELNQYWETNASNENKVITWIDLIAEHSKKIADAQHLNIKEMII
jgi:hypothetical protein